MLTQLKFERGIWYGNQGNVIGFAMGYFKQYDDIIGYTLEEILIASPYQHQGIGSWLLNELEHKVSEKGASILELLAVNDDLHEHYYGKANYYKAANLIPRAKWLQSYLREFQQEKQP